MFVAGDNSKFQLGTSLSEESPANSKSLLRVFPPTKEDKWLSVSCGNTHTMAITSVISKLIFISSGSGQLYGFGSNSFGQIGVEDQVVPCPIFVSYDQLYLKGDQVVHVDCGSHFTVVSTSV